MAQPLLPPTNFRATSVVNGIQLSWDPPAVIGITGFVIRYKTTTASSWSSTSVGVVNSTTISHLVPGITYMFSIKSVKGSSSSPYSPNITEFPALAVPQGLTLTPNGNDVYVTWVPIQGATNYILSYREATVTNWVNSTSSSTNSKTITSILPGRYKFAVRAQKDLSTSGYSVIEECDILLSPPQNVMAIPNSSYVTLNCNLVLGATKYLMKHRIKSNQGQPANNWIETETLPPSQPVNSPPVTSVTANIPNLLLQTVYEFAVVATNGVTNSDFSVIIESSLLISAPLTVYASDGTNFITVNWDAVLTSTSYFINYRKKSQPDPDVLPLDWDIIEITPVNNVLATTGVIPNLIAGIIYEIAVQASDDFSSSVLSTIVERRLVIGSPQNVLATPGNNSVGLIWNNVPGAILYVVTTYISQAITDAKKNVLVLIKTNVTSTNNFVVDGLLDKNINYYFMVRAFDGNAFSTFSDMVISAPKFDTPQNVMSSEINSNSFKATWNKVASAKSYILYYGLDDSYGLTKIITTIDPLDSTVVNNYTFNNLIPNTRYYYAIAAFDGLTTSPLSSTIQVTTLEPIPPELTLTSVTGNTVQFSWTPSTTTSGLTRISNIISYMLDGENYNDDNIEEYPDVTGAGVSIRTGSLTLNNGNYKFQLKTKFVDANGEDIFSSDSNEIGPISLPVYAGPTLAKGSYAYAELSNLGTLTLNWTQTTPAGLTISKFYIYSKEGNNEYNNVPEVVINDISNRSVNLTMPRNNKTYKFIIKTEFTNGPLSAASNEVTHTYN